MTWQEPQDDPLDELLRAARWSDADASQTANLEQRWQRIRRRQRVVERVRIAGAAVVVLTLVGGGVAWWTMSVEPASPEIVEVSPIKPAERIEAPPRSQPVVAEETPRPAPGAAPVVEPATSREATPFELAIVRRQRKVRAAKRQPVEQAAPAESEMDVVEQTILRLAVNPDDDLDAAAVALGESQPDAERRLQRLAEQSRGEKQIVALRMLAKLATRESLLLLVNQSLRARCPQEVLAAIERLCETHELAELAYRANGTERRREWIAALLRRDSSESTPAYLALLRNPSTTQDAIVVLASATNPPIEGLFAALGSPDADERLVAARALAARNDPAVSSRLARIVMQNNARREALVALLMSKDAVASEFLAFARADQRLGPSVQAVSAQMASDFRLN